MAGAPLQRNSNSFLNTDIKYAYALTEIPRTRIFTAELNPHGCADEMSVRRPRR